MLMPKDLLRDLEDHDRTREVLRKLLSEPERRNHNQILTTPDGVLTVNAGAAFDNTATIWSDSDMLTSAIGTI